MKYSIILAAALATMGGFAMAEQSGEGGEQPPVNGCESSVASCDGGGETGGGEQPGEGEGEGGGEGGGGEGGGA